MWIKDSYSVHNMADAEHIKTGKAGEDLACKWLKKRGFAVKERNVRYPWGEIDIVCVKDGVTHLVEVKSTAIPFDKHRVGRERYRPEDHLHGVKLRRFKLCVEAYSTSRGAKPLPYTADVLIVHVNHEARNGHVEAVWDVELA